MNTRLLHSSVTSDHVLVYTGGISDKSFCAATGAKSRGAETQLVMADSRTVGNVVQPLAQSVVEPSTTGVDASITINELTASGGSTQDTTTSNTQQQIQLHKQQESKENSNEDSFSEESGADSISAGLMNSRYAGTKDTDTESVGTSRPGSTSPTKMDTVKPKPTVKKQVFKPVSVNKWYLKDATPTLGPVSNTLSSSLSHKVSPAFSAAQPAPRNVVGASKLKLVKTGTSSQNLRLGSTGSTGSAGPRKGDQAQPVWNKNLPTPPPPKKDVTDEELKNSFGIHLAQRLDPNESKEAKWADIDDDDDDWVPEVIIEWNDGMKVTLEDMVATAEETVVSPPTTSVEPTRPEPVQEVTPPKSPLPTPAVPVKGEVRPKTLITEKPSLKPVESLSTHPVRASPWAKIPTPSVASPTVMNSTHPRNSDFHPPRHEFRPESPSQHTPSSCTGMKEVSADVYDRSWRERPVNHGPRERELFNSETGQLEPVRETRNGGARPNRSDAPMNKPSLLQRPTGAPQYSQQSGPAEPSAAFQQSRSSINFHRPEDYGRRRASSNVSGASGSTGGRRPSFTTSRFSADQLPTPDDVRLPIDPRRGSFGYNNNPFDNEGPRGSHSSSSPYSPQFQHPVPHLREISPRMAVASPILGRPGPPFVRPPVIQQMPPPSLPLSAPVFDPNYEDPIAQQERVMKESRETARKRRQEEEAKEEAKEEAAKQERLRIKLEELEKQAKIRAEEEATKKKAIEEKAEAERKVIEEKRLAEEEAAAKKKAADEKAAAERRAEEEVASVKADETSQTLETERPRQAPFSDRQARQPPQSLMRSQSPGSAARIPAAPQAQGRRQSGPIQSQRSPTKGFEVLGNRESRDQPWKNGPPGPDRYTSWGNTPGINGQAQNPTDGNPWGPIGEKSRFSGFNGVGNGTFDNRYSGFSARSNAPNSMHGQQGKDDRRPGRSGPYSGFPRNPRPNDSISHEDRAQAVNRWNTVASTLQSDETEEKRKNREERLAKEAEDVAAGIKKEPVTHPKIVETWRKVELKDGSGEINRKLIAVSKTERDEAIARGSSPQSTGAPHPPAPSAIASASTQSTVTTSQSQPSHLTHKDNIPTGPAASRPTSRFFPAAASILAQHLGSPSKPLDEPAPKVNPPGSPPPPMSSEHPVHGDKNLRIVQLPPSPQSQQVNGRISPSIRLNNGFHKVDASKSPRPSSFNAIEALQQKILEKMANSTQKQHSPPQHSTYAHQHESKATYSKDFSVTKPTFEEIPGRENRPSVSLPGSSHGSSHGSKDSSEKGDVTTAGEVQMDGGCILSKPDDEEFFHGLFERDFGSTPTVKIPHQAPHIFNNGSMCTKPPVASSPKKNKGSLFKSQQPQTIHMFDAFVDKDFVNDEGKRFVPVHLPGRAQFEVVCKGQEGKRGKKSSYPRRKPPGRFATGGGHIGHGRSGGSVGNGRKMTEAVQ